MRFETRIDLDFALPDWYFPPAVGHAGRRCARNCSRRGPMKRLSSLIMAGLAAVVGEIQPQGCIMAGEAPEPHWQRKRREKRAEHKAARREGAAEIGDV